MKNTRNFRSIICILLVCILLLCLVPAWADKIFAPHYLWTRNIAAKTDPVGIADTHLGIPYREDGALDSEGNFTTFGRPDFMYRTPGLNCSGLVLSVSRFLFNKNFALSQATRDRQGNSGAGAPLGQDWDFGLDLILNITDGTHRRVIMPDGKEYPLDNADGALLRGFDLDDQAAWQMALNQMKPGRVYFGSISKPSSQPGYRLLHYHVVLIIPDEKGAAWLYHATQRSNVHKMNLRTEQGMTRLMSQFRNSRRNPKKILVVEAMLPRSGVGVARVADEADRTSPATQVASNAVESPLGRALQLPGQNETAPRREPEARLAPEDSLKPERPAQPPPAAGPGSEPNQEKLNLMVNHLSGKVFNAFPDLVTHIPHFAGDDKSQVRLWFANRGTKPRSLDIRLQGPDGEHSYRGQLPAQSTDVSLAYPRDFMSQAPGQVKKGRYAVQVKVDGVDWCADAFEIAVARDAKPRIVRVKAPSTVREGSTFNVEVVAQNEGAESDYGGITVSSPDPSGLNIVSAKPGKIHGRGSTVLSVTSDRIRTKVPMAERWIELWGDGQPYEMVVTVKAGRPGTYPLYVRCALRSVSAQSNVILMDPPTGDTADQQGFPVKVLTITVQ